MFHGGGAGHGGARRIIKKEEYLLGGVSKVVTDLEQQKIKKTTEDVLNLARIAQDYNKQIKELSDKEKNIKEEIRGLMKEIGEKFIKDEDISIEIRYPTPEVDPGLLRIDFPEIAKQFVEEQIKVFISAKNRKKLEVQFPDAYNKCKCEESTPRLYIK